MHARTHVQSACAPFFLDAWISRKCFSLLVWIYTRRQTHAVCHCLESASPGQRLRRRRFLSIMLQSAAQLPSFPRGRGVENSVPRLVPLSGYPCPALNPPPTHTHSPGRQSYAPEPYLAGARVAQLVPAYYPLSVSCAHRAAHTQRLHTHTTRSCPCTRGACDRRCRHQLRLPWQVSAHTRQQGKLRPQQSSGRRAAKRRRPTQDYTRAPNLQ
jgi:hypothetical protein